MTGFELDITNQLTDVAYCLMDGKDSDGADVILAAVDEIEHLRKKIFNLRQTIGRVYHISEGQCVKIRLIRDIAAEAIRDETL